MRNFVGEHWPAESYVAVLRGHLNSGRMRNDPAELGTHAIDKYGVIRLF
jgi:hypothetical protein